MEHGGNLVEASTRYGIEPGAWLDLSTGISPWPYPIPEVSARAWHRLPEENGRLHAAAERYYGAPNFLITAGSQAAISALPRLVDATTVALMEPSYGEHRNAWARQARVEGIGEDQLASALARNDALVLCNPDNPTGKLHSIEELGALAEDAERDGKLLVIDEAFVDTEPRHSLVPLGPKPGLIVLRSLGKFFGLAGARVGFMFAEPSVLTRARELLGPWAVTGPSLEVAARALSDVPFQVRTVSRLKAAAFRLRTLLSARMEVSGATDYFVWVKTPAARAIQDHLAKGGILIRAFDAPPSIRIGLPADEHDWSRLETAFATF